MSRLLIYTAISYHLDILFVQRTCWQCASLQLGDVGGGEWEGVSFEWEPEVVCHEEEVEGVWFE